MENSNLVPIRTFLNESDARIASAYLESQGIQAYIQKDDCGGNYPQLQVSSGIQLLIHSDDEQKAKVLLSEVESEFIPKQALEIKKTSKGTMLFLITLVFVLGYFGGYFYSRFAPAPRASDVFQTDANGDMRPDVFTYYKSGNLLRVEADRNYDGNIDMKHYYNHNKISYSECDDNFDGKVDGWSKYKDENNYEWKIDTDLNGKPDVTIYFIHQLKARIDWQPNESPVIVKREMFENGNKKHEYIDSDRDGKFDIKLDFNSMGNQVQKIKLK